MPAQGSDRGFAALHLNAYPALRLVTPTRALGLIADIRSKRSPANNPLNST